MLEFGILGPLEVTADGKPVLITAPKQRSLLTLLLLRANKMVSSERLVNEMWGERPPRAAVAALQNGVVQLRQALGKDTIVRQGPGYRLVIDPDQLDLTR